MSGKIRLLMRFSLGSKSKGYTISTLYIYSQLSFVLAYSVASHNLFI